MVQKNTVENKICCIGGVILFECFWQSYLASNEPTYTWSGQLPPRNYKNPIYSNKIFLGGVPWDITEGIYNHLKYLV